MVKIGYRVEAQAQQRRKGAGLDSLRKGLKTVGEVLKPGEEGKCQGMAWDRRQGGAGADGGKAGVKESLFLAHFLLNVFTSITT